ncbi:MAG: hypothetical protein LBM09_00160 [Candidatus Nomurabacteria bacterium]|jgi:hypothetical protein|nr:hypothetical protein [Candidatus Nomurabacteria bacterium]
MKKSLLVSAGIVATLGMSFAPVASTFAATDLIPGIVKCDGNQVIIDIANNTTWNSIADPTAMSAAIVNGETCDPVDTITFNIADAEWALWGIDAKIAEIQAAIDLVGGFDPSAITGAITDVNINFADDLSEDDLLNIGKIATAAIANQTKLGIQNTTKIAVEAENVDLSNVNISANLPGGAIAYLDNFSLNAKTVTMNNTTDFDALKGKIVADEIIVGTTTYVLDNGTWVDESTLNTGNNNNVVLPLTPAITDDEETTIAAPSTGLGGDTVKAESVVDVTILGAISAIGFASVIAWMIARQRASEK